MNFRIVLSKDYAEVLFMSDKVKTTGKDSVRYIIEIVKAVIIATVASLLCV